MSYQYVCVIDNHQAEALCVSIDSCLNFNEKIVAGITVMHVRSCLSIHYQELLTDVARKYNKKISFMVVEPEEIDGLFLGQHSHISYTSYLKLFFKKAVLEAGEKDGFYLDADTIVRQAFFELWHLDNPGLYAVDHHEPYEAERLSLNSTYFNAGFFVVIDVVNSFPKKLKLFEIGMNRKKDIFWHDQDILNLYYNGKWFPLPYSYNVMTRTQRKETVERSKILHFDGANKPWDEKYFHPYRKIWFDAFEQYSGKRHRADSFAKRVILTVKTIKRRLQLRNLIRFIIEG